jgi:anti-sigma-K factor RskA
MTVMCDSAAAYVLGALPASERAEFERHLAECPDCRDTLADLAGIPGLLSRVSPDDLADPLPVPDTLVPRLLRAVRRSSRRRRIIVAALTAAAVLVAIIGTAAVVSRTVDRPTDPPLTAMTAVVNSPVTARAALIRHSWGTEVRMECRYDYSSEWSRPYDLVAVNDSGESRELATWVVGPSHEASVSGSLPWQPDKIDRLEIRLVSGQPLLRLSP